MKKEARDVIVKMFCDMQNITHNALEDKLEEVVSEFHAPSLLFLECLGTKQFKERNNAFDGFFINMLHRSANTLGSMVSLMSTGYLQEAEILSRTLSESTLTTQCLLKGNVSENISNYLASYYVGQQWKNDKWETVVNNNKNKSHLELIEEKNVVEEQAKNICKEFIELAGGKWPIKPKSLSVDKIYKLLNREIEYRTVYRAMCGQSHQNQEDIVNSLLYSLVNDPDIEKRTKAQKHCFSIFVCLWGIKYYVEAMVELGTHFKFQSVQHKSKLSLAVIEGHLEEVGASISKNSLPSGWSRSVIEGI
ncbi:MAG: DUF5677 domain-containing protein [Sedimenticola sp.]